MRISDWSSDVCSSDLQQREDDAQHERGHDADEDHLPALLRRESGRKRAHNDRIVARKHDVDHQHLPEGSERRWRADVRDVRDDVRSEAHTSELQSLMRTSYAGLCLTKKIHTTQHHNRPHYYI